MVVLETPHLSGTSLIGVSPLTGCIAAIHSQILLKTVKTNALVIQIVDYVNQVLHVSTQTSILKRFFLSRSLFFYPIMHFLLGGAEKHFQYAISVEAKYGLKKPELMYCTPKVRPPNLTFEVFFCGQI